MKKSRKRQIGAHIFRFKLSPESQQVVAIKCAADFATRSLNIQRTAEHVMKGKRGQAMECPDLICAKAHKKDFKRIGVNLIAGEFSRSRFYAIDKVGRDGTPLHCTIFAHDDPTIQQIDDGTLAIGDASRRIHLSPPDRRLGAHSKVPGKRNGRLSKPRIAKGAAHRLLYSGDIAGKTIRKLAELNAA